ncbi:DNA cytosine methyltransferase [Bauldia litoralis]|nr:DNA (cytosine-5-)-methyltransferase [Bauldia litoralis]
MESEKEGSQLRICSLFSGIGGFEVGLRKVGFEVASFCENDAAAQAVLEDRFVDASIFKDVAKMNVLPNCDVVTAGWPCQDLSQAGKVAGMKGSQSNIISHLFRLLDSTRTKPKYLILENVAFALHLRGGEAIKDVTVELSKRGYYWAYRVLDSREFGLPQRRRRIFIVASRVDDAMSVIFDGDSQPLIEEFPSFFGFYWTEGNRGIGWTVEAVPPLKGGSGFSIPSPPAVWDQRNATFFIPGIRDAEKLQGFSLDWTKAAEGFGGERGRWRLVGNAVSPPVARWIGKRLKQDHRKVLLDGEKALKPAGGRHNMASGGPKKVPEYWLTAVEGPKKPRRSNISNFYFRDKKALSLRAASGFTNRLINSSLRWDPEFMKDLRAYTGIDQIIEDKVA